MQTLGFWVETPGRGVLRDETLAEPGPAEVRVRSLYSGISRGTEALVFWGRVPPSEYRTMRAPFQQGDFPGPVKYGYSSVGMVEAGAPEWLGRAVYCLYPHQAAYVVPVHAVLPLPDHVPAGRAVLAANLETAVNATWDAQPGAGDRIVVIGAGVVGLLVGWLCRQIPGTDVTMVDINPRRAAVAAALGLTLVGSDQAPQDADLVVHASGQPAGLAHALTLAGDEAVILELSWYGDRPVSLALGGAFHQRRLTLRSSQVGHLPPARRPRWDYARRLHLALNLLQAPELDVLISGESKFTELPAVMPHLCAENADVLCHRIAYS